MPRSLGTTRKTGVPGPSGGGADSAPAGTVQTRRTVSFSQGGLRGGGGQLSVTAALIPLFLLWGALAGIGAFFALGRFAWMPAGARAALVTSVFVIAAFLLFRMAVRGYRRVTRSIKLPMEMDPSADVNVVCWPDQKDDLEDLIPEAGVAGAFEPEFFRVWIASRRPRAERMLSRSGHRREVLRVVVIVLTIQGTFSLAAFGIVPWELIVGVAAAALLTPFIRAFVVPTYLRVIPGRVDVVRFRLMRSVASVERIDLRDRPVRLDMKRKELLVGWWHATHPEPEPMPGPKTGEADDPKSDPESDPVLNRAPRTSQSLLLANSAMKDPQGSLGSAAQIRAVRVVPLWGSLDIGGAARAVFRAAVSTAEPGPVPDDRLL